MNSMIKTEVICIFIILHFHIGTVYLKYYLVKTLKKLKIIRVESYPQYLKNIKYQNQRQLKKFTTLIQSIL